MSSSSPPSATIDTILEAEGDAASLNENERPLLADAAKSASTSAVGGQVAEGSEADEAELAEVPHNSGSNNGAKKKNDFVLEFDATDFKKARKKKTLKKKTPTTVVVGDDREKTAGTPPPATAAADPSFGVFGAITDVPVASTSTTRKKSAGGSRRTSVSAAAAGSSRPSSRRASLVGIGGADGGGGRDSAASPPPPAISSASSAGRLGGLASPVVAATPTSSKGGKTRDEAAMEVAMQRLINRQKGLSQPSASFSAEEAAVGERPPRPYERIEGDHDPNYTYCPPPNNQRTLLFAEDWPPPSWAVTGGRAGLAALVARGTAAAAASPTQSQQGQSSQAQGAEDSDFPLIYDGRFIVLSFSSDFDSGNLIQVERTAPYTYNLHCCPDCGNAPYQTNNKQWFHFSVRGLPRGVTLKITMVGVANSKMYTFGWVPVTATVPMTAEIRSLLLKANAVSGEVAGVRPAAIVEKEEVIAAAAAKRTSVLDTMLAEEGATDNAKGSNDTSAVMRACLSAPAAGATASHSETSVRRMLAATAMLGGKQDPALALALAALKERSAAQSSVESPSSSPSSAPSLLPFAADTYISAIAAGEAPILYARMAPRDAKAVVTAVNEPISIPGYASLAYRPVVNKFAKKGKGGKGGDDEGGGGGDDNDEEGNGNGGSAEQNAADAAAIHRYEEDLMGRAVAVCEGGALVGNEALGGTATGRCTADAVASLVRGITVVPFSHVGPTVSTSGNASGSSASASQQKVSVASLAAADEQQQHGSGEATTATAEDAFGASEPTENEPEAAAADDEGNGNDEDGSEAEVGGGYEEEGDNDNDNDRGREGGAAYSEGEEGAAAVAEAAGANGSGTPSQSTLSAAATRRTAPTKALFKRRAAAAAAAAASSPEGLSPLGGGRAEKHPTSYTICFDVASEVDIPFVPTSEAEREALVMVAGRYLAAAEKVAAETTAGGALGSSGNGSGGRAPSVPSASSAVASAAAILEAARGIPISPFPQGHPKCPSFFVAGNHPYSFGRACRHLLQWRNGVVAYNDDLALALSPQRHAFGGGVGAASPPSASDAAATVSFLLDEDGVGAGAGGEGTTSSRPTTPTAEQPAVVLCPITGKTLPSSGGIYFNEEVLCVSPDGHDVHLLTITGIGRRTRVGPREDPIATVGGGGGSSSVLPCRGERPLTFPDKKYIVISARIHPGETPASYLQHGAIDFILHPTDPRAARLRRECVVLIVPIINPDGTMRGHSRADTTGQNLNRCYRDPSFTKHPSPFAVKHLLLYLQSKGRLHLFLDLHAHANKKGTFAYGNGMGGAAMVQNLLYTKLAGMNSPYFEFPSCNFSEGNMFAVGKTGEGKDCSSRVTIYQDTGFIHSYTVEANYVAPSALNPVIGLPILPQGSHTVGYTVGQMFVPPSALASSAAAALSPAAAQVAQYTGAQPGSAAYDRDNTNNGKATPEVSALGLIAASPTNTSNTTNSSAAVPPPPRRSCQIAANVFVIGSNTPLSERADVPPGGAGAAAVPSRYSPATHADVGRGLVLAFLDLHNLQPEGYSRVALGAFRNVRSVGAAVARYMLADVVDCMRRQVMYRCGISHREFFGALKGASSSSSAGSASAGSSSAAAAGRLALYPSDLPASYTVKGSKSFPPTTVFQLSAIAAKYVEGCADGGGGGSPSSDMALWSAFASAAIENTLAHGFIADASAASAAAAASSASGGGGGSNTVSRKASAARLLGGAASAKSAATSSPSTAAAADGDEGGAPLPSGGGGGGGGSRASSSGVSFTRGGGGAATPPTTSVPVAGRRRGVGSGASAAALGIVGIGVSIADSGSPPTATVPLKRRASAASLAGADKEKEKDASKDKHKTSSSPAAPSATAAVAKAKASSSSSAATSSPLPSVASPPAPSAAAAPLPLKRKSSAAAGTLAPLLQSASPTSEAASPSATSAPADPSPPSLPTGKEKEKVPGGLAKATAAAFPSAPVTAASSKKASASSAPPKKSTATPTTPLPSAATAKKPSSASAKK